MCVCVRVCPWYNDSIRTTKCLIRQLERRWRTTGLECDRLAYCFQRQLVVSSIHRAKVKHHMSQFADVDRHAHTHKHTPTQTYPRTCTKRHTHPHTRTHTRQNTHTNTHAPTLTNTHSRTHIHTGSLAHIRTHTHPHTHARTHTRTQTDKRPYIIIIIVPFL